MNNLLAVDIGNTNIALGLFKNGKLVKKASMPTHTYSMYDRGLKSVVDGACDIVISSVVPLALSRLIMHIKKNMGSHIYIIGRDIKVPIVNKYRVKSEVGQDRLVNAFAARTLYGAPSIVIDFGTAITFDIISAKAEYLGGLILPGIGLSLSGLYEKTALLPRVEIKKSGSIIGKDTENSMRAGLLFGFGAMCDGLIAKYKKILGPRTRVIATGGDSALVRRYAKSIDKVDGDLTLKGIFLMTKD